MISVDTHTVSQASMLRVSMSAIVSPLKAIVRSRLGVLVLVVITDICTIALAFVLFYTLRVNAVIIHDPMRFPIIAVLQTLVFIVIYWEGLFWFSGAYIYVHNRSLFDELLAINKILVAGVIFLFVALVVEAASYKSDNPSHRVVSLLAYFVFTSGAIGVGRWAIRFIVRALRRRGIGLRRTIIIGDSAQCRQLRQMFDASPELGYLVVDMVSYGSESNSMNVRKVDSFGEIDQILANLDIEVSVLGLETRREDVPRLLAESTVAETTIKIIPDLYDLVSGRARAQHLYGIPLIEVNPSIMPVWEQNVKRFGDLSISLFVLIVGLPIWIAFALVIKLSDRGPILYAQERVGLNGRTYMMLKFRSMRTDAEKEGISWTMANDPRVTRAGRFLRRTHLDEVPQLINVVRGEMSLVGPRPERPFYVEKYSRILPAYPRRLRVKPGLTGWNQVHMETMSESVEFIQERLRHDFFYIENMSLRLDIEIIFRTILRVIQRKGQA